MFIMMLLLFTFILLFLIIEKYKQDDIPIASSLS
jgi:hypothetical protein